MRARRRSRGEALYENGTLAKGTLPVGENRAGRMCTCSDKIASWNALGVQGSLLATKLTEPIFIQSITIGRKFAYKHCARAFCCRVSKTFPSVNHPVLMQCERKFDLAPIDTDSVVVFDNPHCLIWTASEEDVIEVCNGKTVNAKKKKTNKRRVLHDTAPPLSSRCFSTRSKRSLRVPVPTSRSK